MCVNVNSESFIEVKAIFKVCECHSLILFGVGNEQMAYLQCIDVWYGRYVFGFYLAIVCYYSHHLPTSDDDKSQTMKCVNIFYFMIFCIIC